jgi:PHP family Zn ribbon phosphoesterase
MDLEGMSRGAKLKGLDILGTGDVSHPIWFHELKQKLEPIEGAGLFRYNDIYFMLTTEVSTVFQFEGATKKIHHIIHAPSFDVVEQINENLSKYGNLKADGRPTLTISAPELVENLMEISKEIVVTSAHIWTPWFSLFGSKSGFDRVEDCYQDQTKNIFSLETGLSCYDKETEVLTDNGWKKINNVRYSDKICTLNPKTNEIEFRNPIKIHNYHYKGKMYRLKTKRVDLFVTPNHRLFCSACDSREQPKFILREAEFLFNKPKRFKKDGIWIGREIKYFVLPSVKIKRGSRYYSGHRIIKGKKIPIKPWLKFFGFWMAEGWTSGGKDGDYSVCLRNKDNALLFEMKNILEGFGYNVYWDKKTNNTIRVRDYQLFHYLKQFGKCSDKFIPKEIKSLSKDLLEIFFEYYIKGDGHACGRNKKGLSATTTSARLRDDLQEIALKIGLSAYYKLDRKKGTPPHSPAYKNKKIYKQRKDAWTIYFIRKNIHTVTPSTIKKYKYTESWVDFEGPVFCVTVQNHVIYIRRNGIPVWCGNSDPAMNWRLSALDKFTLVSNSDSHSPHPWRLGREANVFDLKKVTYREIFNAIKDKDKEKFLFTIEVEPSYGKYHFDGHRNCGISLAPAEAKKFNNICPKCKRRLTIGVLHRVEDLADRPEGFVPKDAIPFKTLLPLYEIISYATGTNELYSQKVIAEQNKLIEKFGNEFNVLLNVPKEELAKNTSEKIADAIIKVREGKVKFIPGYDGVYGRIEFLPSEISAPPKEKRRKAEVRLEDFM